MCKRITAFAIIALALLIQPQPLLSSPSPDFNGDGVVNTADFLLFVQHFGTTEERYDLNADGTVDAADFLIFVEHFGKDAPPSGTGSGGGGSDGGVLVTGMTNLTNNDRNGWSNGPFWSPDGRFIAFFHEEHINITRTSYDIEKGIYKMDPDGRNRTRISNLYVDDVAPTLTVSPDGRFIALSINQDIYRVDSDGRNEAQLTLNPANDSGPTWSPDSRFIAFVSNRDPAGIYRMDPDGGNVTLLSKETGGPSWSPDGRFIAFLDHDGWWGQIRRMDSDGRNPTDFLTYPDPGTASSLDWSPDSRFIAFATGSDAAVRHSEIYVMDSDGNNLTRLTSGPAVDSGPTWSPDGRFIAFVSNRDGNDEIYIVGSDGRNLTRVTNHPDDNYAPTWSPDGRFIAFTTWGESGINIYRAEIEFGTGGEKIVTFSDSYLNKALANSLGREGPAPSITTAEMTTLRTFNASNKDISDLTGLEHATNLTELNLTSNRISDITLLTGLTKLTRLSLGGNRISDLAPLVANTGLDSGDEVDLRDNPLSTTSRNTHIQALQARGVNVRF